MKRIKVTLEHKVSASYEICIGRDILDRAALLLAKHNWASRYFMISDANVWPLHGERVLSQLSAARLKTEVIVLPAGEEQKTIETCVGMAATMLEKGADRTSGIIALGGGVVGDMAGFVASIYMRGIPYVQMPTTLLAQVDSSIGGKTGVDVPAAKNILGTFNQPKAVFIDLAFLDTLPERQWANGLAEIVKYGVIEDPELLEILADQSDALRLRDGKLLAEVVARSCRIKKGVVEIDEKEKGLRRILNFGHTLGHAIEAESRFSVAHGEAVALGMVGAAHLSERLHYLPAEDRERLVSVIRQVGLPVRLPADLATEGILARLKNDKKKEGDVIHFVLVKKLGMPFINGGVSRDLIRDVLQEGLS